MKYILSIWLSMVFINLLFAQQPKLILPFGHSGPVLSVEFSPDNKRFITGSVDQNAKLWDTESNKILANFVGHDDQVSNTLFSADAKFIITAGGSKLFVWDAKTGEKLNELILDSFISTVKISPNSKNILVGLSNGHVKIFDFNSKIILKDLNCYIENTVSNEVVTTLNERLAELEDLIKAEKDKDDKKELEEEKKELKNALKMMNSAFKNESGIIGMPISDVSNIAFSNDNNLIATCVNDVIKIWSSKNFNLIKEIKRPDGPNMNCQFDQNNLSILCFSKGGFINTWNIKSGKKLFDYDNSKDFKIIYSAFSNNETLFSLSENGELKIYNSKIGKLIKETILKTNYGKMTNAVILPSKNQLIVAYEGGQLIKWEISSGIKLLEFIGHKKEVLQIKFSSDQNKIITSSKDNTVKIWDNSNAKLLSEIGENLSEIKSAFFSNDNNSIIVNQKNQTINIWDFMTGKNIKSITHQEKNIEFARFDAEDKNIIVSINDGKYKEFIEPNKFKILDEKSQNYFGQKYGYRNESYELIEKKYPTSGNNRINFVNLNSVIENDKLKLKENIRISQTKFQPFFKGIDFNSDDDENSNKRKPNEIYPDGDGILNYAKFSPDGNKLLVASSEMRAFLYNSNDTRNLIKELEGHENAVNYVDFSKSGNLALPASHDGTAKVWNLGYGKKPPLTLSGHLGKVNTVQFNNDETKIITSSEDNTFKIWNATTGYLIANFFTFDNKKLITTLPNAYYSSSIEGAKKLHYVSNDLKIITFEQLDVKYNRPDKVLKALGNTDSTLINSYKRAYDKRIEKLGIDTTAFLKDDYNVPDLDILRRGEISSSQKQKELKLQIRGKDGKSKLENFNLWINEVPIFGQKGINISIRNKMEFDTTISINLTVGDNKIEASVRNRSGLESYRMPINVKYEPDLKPKETIYFIGIGIEKFQNSSKNLQYCSSDIKELAEKFKKKYGSQLIIDTLLNQNVTIQKVKVLKKTLQNSNENDKVILAYSGHGLLSKKLDYYLSTYNVNFEEPEKNGLPYEELENILDGIPARKKLLLIDACHSGEIDKPNITRTNSVSKKTKPETKENRGGEMGDNLAPKIGLENSFELMKDLFVNVGKYTGSIIISAAAGTQAAIESNHLKHGVFTHAILEVMESHKVLKVSELKEIVGAKVEQLTLGNQKPTLRNETVDVDWVIW